jgi:hypothetical protein
MNSLVRFIPPALTSPGILIAMAVTVVLIAGGTAYWIRRREVAAHQPIGKSALRSCKAMGCIRRSARSSASDGSCVDACRRGRTRRRQRRTMLLQTKCIGPACVPRCQSFQSTVKAPSGSRSFRSSQTGVCRVFIGSWVESDLCETPSPGDRGGRTIARLGVLPGCSRVVGIGAGPAVCGRVAAHELRLRASFEQNHRRSNSPATAEKIVLSLGLPSETVKSQKYPKTS